MEAKHHENDILAKYYKFMNSRRVFQNSDSNSDSDNEPERSYPHSKRISLGRTQDILTGCSDIPQ